MPEEPQISDEQSWLPALAEFLMERSEVAAIQFDPDKKKISLATLGEINEADLQHSLTDTLKAAEERMQAESGIPGALTVETTRRGGMILSKPACLTAPTLWRWREFEWPEPVKRRVLEEDWRVLMVQAVICGVAGLTAWGLDRWGPSGLDLWARVFYIIALVAGGWDAAFESAANIRKGKLDIHFLMLAVAVGAVSIGAWTEGALLLFLFSFSGALEHFALHRTRKEVDALFKAAPREATLVLKDGTEKVVPVEEVKPGDMLRIRPGDVFPVDAVLTNGNTAADESNLTGESMPIDKKAGDPLFSGTVNLYGAVQAAAVRPVTESALNKILRLIQEAQNQKAPSQKFTDRFGTRYTVMILSLTTAMFFVWWLVVGLPPFMEGGGEKSALYQSMTLLVVASPCALVLSIPSAILAAIAWGARRGILFRGGAAIEELAEADTVALDKTGTLTTGEMAVDRVESFPPGKEKEVAALAYSLERHSDHPIARAIKTYGERENLEVLELSDVRAHPGMGMKGMYQGQSCLLGRRELLESGPLKEFMKDVPHPAFQFIEVWVIAQGFLGRLLLRDEVRPQSRPVLEQLEQLKLKTVMLTGDRRETADAVAKELGLQEVRSGLKPEDKVDAIRELKNQGRQVVMVGDGLNDAPSLAVADVAVAMGARGSDAALEQSDVVLMQDRIEGFVDAYRLSCASKKIIRQNVTIALGTVIVMVGATLFGVLPLSLGVLAHEGSTVVVCLNSLRLLFLK